MDTGEVKKIVIEQGKSAAQRQGQLKRLFVGAFIYITVVATIFGLVIYDQNNTISNQGQTIDELSRILDRRSPILEYMYCRDRVEDERSIVLSERNSSQTVFVGALLAADSDNVTTNEEETTINNSFQVYLDQEERYTSLLKESNACEEPSIAPNKEEE